MKRVTAALRATEREKLLSYRNRLGNFKHKRQKLRKQLNSHLEIPFIVTLILTRCVTVSKSFMRIKTKTHSRDVNLSLLLIDPNKS